MPWLPDTFVAPVRAELRTGHHLRHIRGDDVAIDYPAVMGSRERLWERYGPVFGWPTATMSYEADRLDLVRHEEESQRLESFNYAVLDGPESELLGCIYIDPPDDAAPAGTDAVSSWWVVDSAVGSPLEHELDVFVPRWLTDAWGFARVHYHP